jgi:hypothetical protein
VGIQLQVGLHCRILRDGGDIHVAEVVEWEKKDDRDRTDHELDAQGVRQVAHAHSATKVQAVPSAIRKAMQAKSGLCCGGRGCSDVKAPLESGTQD